MFLLFVLSVYADADIGINVVRPDGNIISVKSELCAGDCDVDYIGALQYCTQEGIYQLQAVATDDDWHTPVSKFVDTHTVDWDVSQQWCNTTCVGYPVDWGDGLSCCGDDSLSDCGLMDSASVCGQYVDGWKWEDLSSIVGDIKSLTCGSSTSFVVDKNDNIWGCGEEISEVSLQGSLGSGFDTTAIGIGQITGLGIVDITGAAFALGSICSVNIDCDSLFCDAGTCAVPTCNDGAKNYDELGIDCGGWCDALCQEGEGCVTTNDCSSGLFCLNNICSAPTCDDAIKNQGEDEIDCGGPCDACISGSTTTMQPFTIISIENFGYTNGFLCYSDYDQSTNEKSYTIKECKGEHAASVATHSAFQVPAEVGSSELANLAFELSFGAGSGAATINNDLVFFPEKGFITMDVLPDWDGDDDTAHWFFFYGDPNDVTTYLAIGKTADNKLICRVSSSVWIDDGGDYMSTWQQGNSYQVGISWDSTTNTMACWGEVPYVKTVSLPSLPSTGALWFGGAPGGLGGEQAYADISNVIAFTLPYRPEYFCTEDATWSRDLDSYETTCEIAGFTWTGSKCCSEPEDVDQYGLESYSDPATEDTPTPGGCWSGQYAQVGSRWEGSWNINDLRYENYKVVNHQGDFKGCNIPNNDALRLRTDYHTGAPLITENYDSASCTVLLNDPGQAGSLCTSEGWVPWYSEEVAEPKSAPAEFPVTDTPTGCCAVSSCWNGTICISDQAISSSLDDQYGKRCIAGDWITASAKKTWTGANLGFCSADSQCLVSPDTGDPQFNGQPEEYFNDNIPQCIYDEQYIGPYYCENGEWGSRTKLIALQLLEFAETNYPDDYELFCGDYGDFLNFYGYEALSGAGAVSSYIGSPCTNPTSDACVNEYVNEFCGLKYQNKVAFGVSLNEPVDGFNSFLKALGKSPDHCTGITGATYGNCGENIYFNPATESLIYLPTGTLPGATPDALLASRGPLLQTQLDEVVSFAQQREWTLSHDIVDDLFGDTNKFKKLYYARHDSQTLFAFIEEGQFVEADGTWFGPVNYLGLNYNEFTVTDIFGNDACNLVQRLFTGIDWQQCLYVADQMKYAIIYSPTDPLGQKVSASWSDFTSKLRHQ